MEPKNFRDVGDALALWRDPSPIRRGRLLRGGKIDHLHTLEELGSPATIINLRQGPDPAHLSATLVHLPAPDSVENYDTSQHRVRAWIKRALEILADPTTNWPVYVHCTSGRDRTGVIVAAALTTFGIPRANIVNEYMLSDGATADLIEAALDGLAAQPSSIESRLRSALRGAG